MDLEDTEHMACRIIFCVNLPFCKSLPGKQGSNTENVKISTLSGGTPVQSTSICAKLKKRRSKGAADVRIASMEKEEKDKRCGGQHRPFSVRFHLPCTVG